MRSRTVWGAVSVWLFLSVIGCTFVPADKTVDPEPLPPAALSPTVQPTNSPEPTATPVPDGAAIQPTSPPAGLLAGNTALDFTLVDLQGETVSLSSFKGQVVMINFWAVWCGFCRIELPVMQKVYEAYRDKGFVILAVNVQEGENRVRGFVEGLELTFPVLLDQRGEVTFSYRVQGLPTSFFLDKNGVIMGKQLGPVDEDLLEQYLAQAGVE